MNYLQFVNNVLETAKSHKLVYEVGEGDIYEHLNSGDHKYPCVFLTVQNIDSNGSQMTVTGSIFYVDALLSDSSNKLQIQATGMTTLQQIFMRLMDNYPDFDLRTCRYTPFDEKFADLCAGVFSNFTVSFMDDICIVNDDIFEGDEPYIPEPEGKYVTMTVLDGDEGTVIEPLLYGILPTLNLQYRINSNGAWTDFIVGTNDDIHLVSGDWVQFKGINEHGVSTSNKNYLHFSISGNPVALSGNVMSLIDGVGDVEVIPNDYCFVRLFKDSNIKTVSSDFLPATTLTPYCYNRMFANCRNLTQAPSLPATMLADVCYSNMFYGCINLRQAPELNATTIANYCYNSMFEGCTELTTAPELPALTMLPYCYNRMFAYTKIEKSPELNATTLANSCYGQMFYGCYRLFQAPILPATTLAHSCYEFMFNGCTSLVKAPELPATTLTPYCYYGMFENCQSLTQAPELNATSLLNRCYKEMFKNCNNLNYIKCLSTDITATDALTDWLSGVAPSGTFVKKYGVEFLTNSPSGIPEGWTVEEIDVPIPPEPTVEKYLTITVDSNAGETIISPTVNGGLTPPNLQYRINNGNWNDFIVGTTADIHVFAGDVVEFKGVNENYISTSNEKYLNFAISDSVHLSGNVMSLIDGVGETLVIPNEYCFTRLFSNSNIKTVSKDFLPATTLTMCCYTAMFWNCSSLVKAPELPSTALVYGCYQTMFKGCSSLVKAPELPSTTLAVYCYNGMFENCTSLVTAPELPATTLVMECYRFMFSGCTKLNYVKSLATTGIINEFGMASSSIEYWLQNVASKGTFVKPAGVKYLTGKSGIPQGWKVENLTQ